MNGELAQIISLVSHGNLFLHGGEVDLSTNSTFQFVSSIKFARYNNISDQQGVEVANSVSNWFSFLRSIKAKSLWNIAFAWDRNDIPEHVAVAFSGGIPAAIQVDLPDGFELWYPQWKVGDQINKPWVVEYRGLMFPNSHALPVQKMGYVKDHLKKAVSQVEKFSQRSDVSASYWATWFKKSLELLNSSSPTVPFHPDILPAAGYSLETRQVMASAAQSFVFGGMGSWNDIEFDNPETHRDYEKVTINLYNAVKLALVMASNSFGH
jgi:hypothetical protein